MKRASIMMIIVAALFALSWIFKSSGDSNIFDAFLVTFSAFLTLAILSFLYGDNPVYKFAEHLFVGVSAAYVMTVAFWSTIVGILIPRLSETLTVEFFKGFYIPGDYNFFFWMPVILGILLLMRLVPKASWIARWPLAFIVGTTAGLNFIAYLRSDFIKQISATFVPLVVDWHGFGDFFSNLSLSSTGQFMMIFSNWVIVVGVLCGLIYFFFSREHTGAFGAASRFGIWILMITFGASFGYTVMGRISLLVGRLTFLFGDWLGVIQ